MNFFPNNMMPNNYGDANNYLINKLNELENRLKKLEQRITNLENESNNTNYNEPNNSLYMI